MQKTKELTDRRGLSPRVRGNLKPSAAISADARSIPACAGEPQAVCRDLCRCEVYPRVCGGTLLPVARPAQPPGLSPRVRGNPGRRGSLSDGWRSIPACAGEPYLPAAHLRGLRVYPRVCGGTSKSAMSEGPASGLSPRVRGNLVGAVPRPFTVRSIPACAGEPWRPRWRFFLPSVYPRVCGGTRKTPHPSDMEDGLSPRVRGNPPGLPAPPKPIRSIPACAGEPGPAD